MNRDPVNKPCRAIIWIKAEVHELIEPGKECSGNPLLSIGMDLKQPFVVAIDGEDENMTVRKLNEVLAELKKKGI